MNLTSQTRLILAVGLLAAVCAVLLVINVQKPCYWIDEKMSMDIAGAETPLGVMVSAVISPERRPPGNHLGLWAFLKVFGNRGVSGRLYSALWALLLIPGLFLLARELSDERTALIVSLLAVTSPVLVAYGQTIRYYTMVAALAA
jgi:4-amino-4-deoxy-L-arabinose transferase-like glycosyltransferase